MRSMPACGDCPHYRIVSSTNSPALIRRRIFDRIVAFGVESEQIPRLLHMLRQWGSDIDHAAAGKLPIFAREIFAVTDDRMANVRHMCAQLMGTPGHRFEG